MFIRCTTCNTKIRTPDSAAGKRVKCPKCATMLDVPKEDAPPDTGVTVVAPPPAVAAAPPPVPKKPPPWAAKKDDDDDEEEDDRKRPPKKKRSRDRDDDDTDRYGEPRRSTPANQTNGAAVASMILGIIGVAMFFGGCLCGMFTAGIGGILGCGVSLICAIVGLVLGFIGNKPGSEGFAWTGIICSGAVLAFIAMFACLAMFGIGAGITDQILNKR